MFKLMVFVVTLAVTLAANKKNVLMIISDDLRPQLNSYTGDHFPSSVSPTMVTPNTDSLAADSMVFKRAYCQYPLCGPSRTSYMTSRRPDTSNVYTNNDYWRDSSVVSGNFTTIPEHFKNNGYYSVGMGKIFHPGSASGEDDKDYSWSEDVWSSSTFNRNWNSVWDDKSWRSIDAATEAAKPLKDAELADYAVQTIERLKDNALNGVQPFFMAVGFYLPHLPFYFPESYMDTYSSDDINLAPRIYSPENLQGVAHSRSGELRLYGDIAALNYNGDINETIDSSVAVALRRAYYTSVTYVDSLIGKVLDAVEDTGLADDTIIVFLSDHGWHLGDLGMWGKSTTFEYANHVPLMIKVPGTTNGGKTSTNLVELVDVLPTLVELTGVSTVPTCDADEATAEAMKLCTDGTSLVPLLTNPTTTEWKDAAFWQILKGCSRMGYSIRTDQYRYTKFVKFDSLTKKPDWSRQVAAELYDYTSDNEEAINLVDDPKYSFKVSELDSKLKAGWRAVLPATSKTGLSDDEEQDDGSEQEDVMDNKEQEKKRNLPKDNEKLLKQLLKDILEG